MNLLCVFDQLLQQRWWRGRLGVVVPSSNTTVEPEFAAYAPEGIEVYAARMSLKSVTVEALDAMSDAAERAAQFLGDADVDSVAYACTTGSLLHGPGFDAELEATLREAADAAAVATARSVDRALSALGAEQLAVITPYADELDEREASYLADLGYEIVTIDGRGLVDNTAIGRLSPTDAYEQVREVVSGASDVDAVLVSCTNYRTLDVIDVLESDLGVPVVSSNGATLWDALGQLGVTPDSLPGTLGSLDPETADDGSNAAVNR